MAKSSLAYLSQVGGWGRWGRQWWAPPTSLPYDTVVGLSARTADALILPAAPHAPGGSHPPVAAPHYLYFRRTHVRTVRPCLVAPTPSRRCTW